MIRRFPSLKMSNPDPAALPTAPPSWIPSKMVDLVTKKDSKPLPKPKKPNLILPPLSVRLTHPLVNPSLWQSATRLFIKDPISTDYRIPLPIRVKRVIVIGVHGWFPTRLLQRVVGEPVGTSQYFSSKMASAVKSLFQDKFQRTLPDELVTEIPLEGEGMVESRVELLYRQLISHQRWMDDFREATHVIIAAHSQGTPVAVMLLRKLLDEGILDTEKHHTFMLAMAGVCHGPFPHLKDTLIVKYVEAESAKELFEFNSSQSYISQQFRSAMERILNSGIKVCAVGSWYDQVVPLYSSLMHAFHHKNIYRAIHIEGEDYSPDFLSHLVVFAVKLRNMGYHDHQLPVYLSDYLAGNIYGFGTQGHSAVYEESATYLLALEWGFCEPNQSPKKQFQHDYAWLFNHWRSSKPADPVIAHIFNAPLRINPSWIPWSLSMLLHDKQLQANVSLWRELQELIKMYEHWEPIQRPLKELRYRLEPLKSKL